MIYPELEKIKTKQKQIIDSFIEFIQEEGITLCVVVERESIAQDSHEALSELELGNLVLKYFGADPKRVEYERRALLQSLEQRLIANSTITQIEETDK
ncbi:MAG: hypothetical protein AAFO96_03505 [Bacteroidota bacterium]